MNNFRHKKSRKSFNFKVDTHELLKKLSQSSKLNMGLSLASLMDRCNVFNLVRPDGSFRLEVVRPPCPESGLKSVKADKENYERYSILSDETGTSIDDIVYNLASIGLKQSSR
jgi:hypothetical protein